MSGLRLRLPVIRRNIPPMKASAGHVAWVVVSALVSGCGGTVTFRAAEPPPPPPAEVTVGVGASPPPPPAQPAPAPPPPPVTAEANVEVEPIAQGDPEEVSATTEPPDPVYEEETPEPSPGYVWVGGYWGWNGVDWGWHWGRWESPPSGRIYIQPYYERVGPRVVYVQGYWGTRNSPHRSYGGERIHFAPPARPANYHRGEHVVVEHRAGPPPGKRPGNAYVRATGTVRPVPHETVPQHRTASMHDANAPRAEPREEKGNVHEGAVGHEPGKENETGKGHEAIAGHEPPKGHEAVVGRDPMSEHEAAPGKATSKEHEPGMEHPEVTRHEVVPSKVPSNEHEAAPSKEPASERAAAPSKEAPKEHEPTARESTTDVPKKVETENATHSAPSTPAARPPPTPRKVTEAEKKAH
jgi:hypothetical protein